MRLKDKKVCGKVKYLGLEVFVKGVVSKNFLKRRQCEITTEVGNKLILETEVVKGIMVVS